MEEEINKSASRRRRRPIPMFIYRVADPPWRGSSGIGGRGSERKIPPVRLFIPVRGEKIVVERKRSDFPVRNSF